MEINKAPTKVQVVNMFKKTITSTQKDSLIINTDSQIKKTPK